MSVDLLTLCKNLLNNTAVTLPRSIYRWGGQGTEQWNFLEPHSSQFAEGKWFTYMLCFFSVQHNSFKISPREMIMSPICKWGPNGLIKVICLKSCCCWGEELWTEIHLFGVQSLTAEPQQVAQPQQNLLNLPRTSPWEEQRPEVHPDQPLWSKNMW